MKDFAKLSALDYLSIIKRRVWYLILTSTLVGAAVVVYVQQMPSIYKSGTLIQVTPRVVPEDYIRSIDHQTSNELISFVGQQIQTRAFTERIVRDLKLAGPETTALEGAANWVRGNISMSTLSTNLFRLSFTAPDPALAQAVTKRFGDMVIELNDSFRKERVETAGRFLGDEETKAAEAFNQADRKLTEFRNRYFPGLSTEVTPYTYNLLRTQLDTVERNLESLNNQRKSLEIRVNEQKNLNTVRQTPIPVNPAGETGPVPGVSPLEDRLAKKREEYETAKHKYTPNYPGLTALAQEVKSLEAAVVESRGKSPAKPTEPNTRSIIAVDPAASSFALYEAEMRIETDQLNKNIQKEEQAKKELLEKISRYEYQLKPPPAVEQEFATLTREYDTAKATYDSLKGKKLDLEMTARVETSDENVLFKVVDPADLPRYPAGPNRQLYTLAGIMAGILLGFGTVFTREFFDPTLQDEEETVTELGLPVLTCIPKVPPAKVAAASPSKPPKAALNLVAPFDATEQETDRRFHLQSVDPSVRSVMLDQAGLAGEQFRLLRVSLSSLQKQRGLKSILVTSATPNDGKTFVASCLAVMLAQEPGKKVLLIDTDLRTGNLGSVLGISRESTGFTNVIRGTAVLEQSVFKCAEVNLSFLPAGERTEKPTELLSSPEVELQLKWAEEVYDWVVIDAPPVHPLSDAQVIAPLCGTTLLVVSCAQTPKALVKNTIQRIGRERICGIVLNRVRKIKSSNYYLYYQQAASPRQVKK